MLNMVKRLTVYAKNLPELREKEKQIAKDLGRCRCQNKSGKY